MDFLPGIFFDVGLNKLDKKLLSFCFRTVDIRAGQGDSCGNVSISILPLRTSINYKMMLIKRKVEQVLWSHCAEES